MSELKRKFEEVENDGSLENPAKKIKVDPLIDESHSRLTILPINPKFDIFWNLYKKQLESFWQASEIDFSNDFKD
jgi:ribonucleotide reductase beta subunit family protein with ferritin-like domain